MARKFTETPIPLLGGEYYFNRCPIETLTKYDKKTEELIKEYRTMQDEADEINNQIETIERRIENIDKKLELVERKEDPSDDELSSVMKLLDKQDGFYDELEELRASARKFNEEHEDEITKFTDNLNEVTAEKVAETIDGITKEQFLKEYDAVDMRIASNISKYYELCMLGEKESKIQAEIRADREQQTQNRKQFRRRR